MSTNVGLVTAAGFVPPSPSATARVRCVLPAPSGPTSATTAPGNKSAPSRRPNASVAARSGMSRVSMANGRCQPAGAIEAPGMRRAACSRPVLAPIEARSTGRLTPAVRLLLLPVGLRGLVAQVRVHELIEVAVEHVVHGRRLQVDALALLADE